MVPEGCWDIELPGFADVRETEYETERKHHYLPGLRKAK